MIRYPRPLQELIENLRRLPGVGVRSAERFAFQMLDWKKEQLQDFARLVGELPSRLVACTECGAIEEPLGCRFCHPSRTTSQQLCVVSSPRDVFSIEQTGEYQGLYHVLEALLSPIDGRGPERINLAKLRHRIEKLRVRELIIALDATLEGDATALFLRRELENLPLSICRLAFGLPMGSAFEQVDSGTLARALSGRRGF